MKAECFICHNLVEDDNIVVYFRGMPFFCCSGGYSIIKDTASVSEMKEAIKKHNQKVKEPNF